MANGFLFTKFANFFPLQNFPAYGSINLTAKVLMILTKFVHLSVFLQLAYVFIKLTFVCASGDYKMVDSCGNSEVTHSPYVCIL